MGNEGKSLRLRFKGDKIEKKKKKKHQSDGYDKDSRKRSRKSNRSNDQESDVEDVGGDEQAWVAVERLTDLAGPCFLYQKYTPPPNISSTDQTGGRQQFVCLALEPTRNRVQADVVQPSAALTLNEQQRAKASLLLDLDGAEIVDSVSSHQLHDDDEQTTSTSSTMQPTDVMQVWVATRVLDTPSHAPRFTFRSAESRFLTGERNGSVSALTEARGPLEEWTLCETKYGPYAFALQTDGTGSNEVKFLGVDQYEKGTGRRIVRSDFEGRSSSSKSEESTVKPNDLPASAMWYIRVQWKHRHEARKRERGEAPLRDRDPTFRQIRQRQT